MYSMKLTVYFILLFLFGVFAQEHDETEDGGETVVESISGSTVSPSNSSFNEFCKLDFDAGNGTESVERFYYDAEKKACFNFTFTGGITNQNNFGSENECLEQCYIEVGEAVPLNETDIVIIEPRSADASEMLSMANKCARPPKESAKCSGKEVQRFYYSDKWQACFAYKSCSKDQGYESRHSCESDCKPMDGSVCGPEQEPISISKMGPDCSTTTCPTGSICLQGMIPQCCNEESRKNVDLLYSDKCEDGKQADGKTDQYFLATVASTCDDLVCESGFKCQAVGKHFAKCCSTKEKPKDNHRSRDSPLFEAFHQDDLAQSKETSIMSRLHTPAALNICRQPKETGNCSSKIQSFYYDPHWQSCFSFKYSGCYGNDNRFASRSECENQCLTADGSACRGPRQSSLPVKYTNNCKTTVCPYDSSCFEGLKGPECCDSVDQKKFKMIYDEKCPNGRAAAGKLLGDYFAVTFAKSCADLRCPVGYSCDQMDFDLAKCCEDSPFLSKDQPLNSGSTRVNEKCPSIERRLVKSCGRILTDMEVVRRIWLSPRIISSEGILQHLNTMCAKYEEYKSCLTMMTSNAACLDPVLSRKEQMFGFICQKKVRETVSSTDNQRCLRRIAKLKKIRDCEDNLESGLINNVFDKFSVCKAFDRTLECSSSELLKCGPNTFSLMKNIITTLKSNIKECNRRFVPEEDDSLERLIKEHENQASREKTTQQPRVSATKTLIASESGGATSRAKKHDSCPQRLIERAEACTYLISFRKIREIFRFQSDFVLANFDVSNINQYCNHSQSYRKCMELSLSQDENCLVHLKNDPFYSFIVAFDDRLCEKDKQLSWLINSGCLSDVMALNKTKECLEDLETTDGRILCKTTEQMESCLYPKIQAECRLLEANFFTEIYNMMEKRHRFCTPLNSTVLSALRARFLSQLAQQDESMPRPLSINGCGSARRISIFVDHNYIPECDRSGKYKHTQCDHKSGSCWCVDVSSGMPIRGSKVGPGRPLPLCGLNYLFTCEKLPKRKFCDADRTKPQKMERWYREEDKCIRYLFDYCPSSAHIPPMPLRTQGACQSFCLPLNG